MGQNSEENKPVSKTPSQKKSCTTLIFAVLGSIPFLTICGLLIAFSSFFQDFRSNIQGDQANATVVWILEEQLRVQNEIVTLEAQSQVDASGPQATAIANEIQNLSSTQIALDSALEDLNSVNDHPDPISETTLSPFNSGQFKTIGESYEADGIVITMARYEVESDGEIFLSFYISNTSDRKILLRYQNSNFALEDDTGKVYEQDQDFLFEPKQYELSPGESLEIIANSYPDSYREIGSFYGKVPEQAAYLIVKINKFAAMSDLEWRIPITPLLQSPQSPAAGTQLPVLEGFSANGISIVLSDYQIESDGEIILYFNVRNDGSNPIVLRYQDKYFQVTDDLGNMYDQDEDFLIEPKQVTLSSGEVFEIRGNSYPNAYNEIGSFYGIVPSEASYLIVTVTQFGGLENMQWKIPLN